MLETVIILGIGSVVGHALQERWSREEREEEPAEDKYPESGGYYSDPVHSGDARESDGTRQTTLGEF